MRLHFFALGIFFVFLCGACQKNSSNVLLKGKTPLVSDSRGRFFDLNCVRANGPADELPSQCQLTYQSARNTSSQGMVAARGMVSTPESGWVNGSGNGTPGGGWTYNGGPNGPGPGFTLDPGWVNGYTSGQNPNGYYVWNLPAFGASGCQFLWGAQNCFHSFGWQGLPPPGLVNPACNPQLLGYQSVPGNYYGSCGQSWNPYQGQPMPMPYYSSNYGSNYTNTGIPAGRTFSGTCTTHYKDATPGSCSERLFEDPSGNITIPADSGCLSPIPFTGMETGGVATLTTATGQWNAQPAGLTLTLSFTGSQVTGSGSGISDPNYTFSCSFQ